jgi:hypothetical protein
MQNTKYNLQRSLLVDDEYSNFPPSSTNKKAKLICSIGAFLFQFLGSWENDLAERTAELLSTLRNLNQVILAEGNTSETT